MNVHELFNMQVAYKITLDECKLILQQHLKASPNDNIEIIDFEQISLSRQVIGIMGGHYKLHIEAKVNNEPITTIFFEKRIYVKYEMQRQYIQEVCAYKKEKFAYEFYPKIEKAVVSYKCDSMPRLYFTVRDNVFILEDLGQVRYMTNRSGTFYFDMEHLLLALDALAKFHAGSIVYERYKSKKTGKKYRLPDEYSEYFKESLYIRNDDSLANKINVTCKEAVLALIDILPQFTSNRSSIRDKFLAQTERIYDLIKKSDKYCNVICHGSLWPNNLLFKYNGNQPTHCKFIDFQNLRYTVPATDVLKLIHFANTADFCDKHENELIEHYYTSLSYHLRQCDIDVNERMTQDEFKESIEYIRPYIIVHKVCSSQMCLMTIDTKMKTDEEYLLKYLFENKKDTCVKMYQNQMYFKLIIDNAFSYLNKL